MPISGNHFSLLWRKFGVRQSYYYVLWIRSAVFLGKAAECTITLSLLYSTYGILYVKREDCRLWHNNNNTAYTNSCACFWAIYENCFVCDIFRVKNKLHDWQTRSELQTAKFYIHFVRTYIYIFVDTSFIYVCVYVSRGIAWCPIAYLAILCSFVMRFMFSIYTSLGLDWDDYGRRERRSCWRSTQ